MYDLYLLYSIFESRLLLLLLQDQTVQINYNRSLVKLQVPVFEVRRLNMHSFIVSAQFNQSYSHKGYKHLCCGSEPIHSHSGGNQNNVVFVPSLTNYDGVCFCGFNVIRFL